MIDEIKMKFGVQLPKSGKPNEKFLKDDKIHIFDSGTNEWVRQSRPKVLDVYYDYPSIGWATVVCE